MPQSSAMLWHRAMVRVELMRIDLSREQGFALQRSWMAFLSGIEYPRILSNCLKEAALALESVDSIEAQRCAVAAQLDHAKQVDSLSICGEVGGISVDPVPQHSTALAARPSIVRTFIEVLGQNEALRVLCPEPVDVPHNQLPEAVGAESLGKSPLSRQIVLAAGRSVRDYMLAEESEADCSVDFFSSFASMGKQMVHAWERKLRSVRALIASMFWAAQSSGCNRVVQESDIAAVRQHLLNRFRNDPESVDQPVIELIEEYFSNLQQLPQNYTRQEGIQRAASMVFRHHLEKTLGGLLDTTTCSALEAAYSSKNVYHVMETASFPQYISSKIQESLLFVNRMIKNWQLAIAAQ